MRQLLFTILVCCTCAIASFGQPKADEPIAHIQKFYFPVSLYNDSIAFDKAMPDLSEKLMNGSSEKEKKVFEKIANYYLLLKDYPKAIESIDSLQKKQDDQLVAMELEVYAKAKIIQKNKGVEFDQAFRQEFTTVYNSLSFRQKVSEAMFDSATISDMRKDYTDFKEKLKKNNVDSLSFEDAQSLVDKYSNYKFYGGVYPLISPLIAGPQYQQMHPAIKGYKWSGVVPVQGVDEVADRKMKYKLLMELTGFAAKGQEATAKNEINGGLGEVARKVNLHVAAGVPKENIDLVIIVHAGALFSLLNNDKYKRKYGIDNPNIALIKELQDFGAKIVVCGQAMTFLRLEKEDLVAGIKQAVSAQTVLSTYELKGYKLYDVSLD